MPEFKNLQKYRSEFATYRTLKELESDIKYMVHKVLADALFTIIPSEFFTLNWVLRSQTSGKINETLSLPLEDLLRPDQIYDRKSDVVGISVMVREEYRNYKAELDDCWVQERELHEVLCIQPSITIRKDGLIEITVYSRIHTPRSDEDYQDTLTVDYKYTETSFVNVLAPFIHSKKEIINDAFKVYDENY